MAVRYRYRNYNASNLYLIYTEAPSMVEAGELASEIRAVIKRYISL